MIYDLTNSAGSAQKYLDSLKEKKSMVEIKRISKVRTPSQNNALHLLFEHGARELNNLGITFVYRGLKGMEIETRWTKELFKEIIWRPIQRTMFKIESTTKINTHQIDAIFEALNKFFAERGVELSFPNQFDKFVKSLENDRQRI